MRARGMAALAAGLVLAGAGGAAAGGSPSDAPPPSEEGRVAEALQSALVAHGADVNRCFEKALADSLNVAGKVELAVDVGDGGKVTKAAPAVDEVKSPILVACLAESAETWTLAGVDPGSTVILPLAFEGQNAQFSIKVADAPTHGPPPRRRGLPGGGRPAVGPPFSIKLLVDEATMHATHASLSQLTISSASRIAMHKHKGAEILYVTKGRARVVGPRGVAPEKLEEGTAIFIPAGMPHALENMVRTAPAVLLQVFAPSGPERVYRDPSDPRGRAAFEVIRDPRKASAPEGAHFTVVSRANAETVPIPGKGRVHIFFEEANTGSNAAYFGIQEISPGAEIPRHAHAGSAEILYVMSGGGELTVGSEKIPFGSDQVIHIPEDQPHSAHFAGGEKTVMLQIYAPAGPEQRWKKPSPAALKSKGD